MSSPEAQKQNLIPAGLPLSYIAGYAVVGIASLTYISVMMSGSLSLSLETAATGIARDGQSSIEHNLAAAGERSAAQANRQTAGVEPPRQAAGQAARNATQVPSPSADQVAAAEPSPGIETKYVTTQQILASRLGEEPAQPSPDPARVAAAHAAQATAPASNITTGSITVPPPPERAPPRPAITRTVLKPALAPAVPRPPQRQAPRKQEAKAPAAPVEFGPAVVTQSQDQPPAIAILLASGSSVESLRSTWNLLRERHAAALGNLQPRYILEKNPAVPERGYALLAGPVVSATDVARVCSVLVSEGLTCRTTTFGGNAL